MSIPSIFGFPGGVGFGPKVQERRERERERERTRRDVVIVKRLRVIATCGEI
jgi:hypothetical protein